MGQDSRQAGTPFCRRLPRSPPSPQPYPGVPPPPSPPVPCASGPPCNRSILARPEWTGKMTPAAALCPTYTRSHSCVARVKVLQPRRLYKSSTHDQANSREVIFLVINSPCYRPCISNRTFFFLFLSLFCLRGVLSLVAPNEKCLVTKKLSNFVRFFDYFFSKCLIFVVAVFLSFVHFFFFFF